MNGSPPSWWSGLKYRKTAVVYGKGRVSTLVVEWIEIVRLFRYMWNGMVSTLVVEWIEIAV